MKRRWIVVAAVPAMAAIFLLLAGCTDQERMGVSPIPQNSPGSWELSPYGAVGN